MACVGLLFIAVPTASGVSDQVGDALSVGAAFCAALIVPARLKQFGRLGAWVSAFVFTYFMGGFFYPGDPVDATAQATTTVVAGAAIMLFALYGADMLSLLWFRQWAGLLAVTGVVGVIAGDHPKNISGGAIIYLLTLMALIFIYSKPERGLFYASTLFATSGAVALAFDFRSMVLYSLVMLLAYWGSSFLSQRIYWWAGVLGCATVIGALTWYFLNAFTSPLALEISRQITDTSGRRATSGREWLWPAIVHFVQDRQWTGAGVGVLPRDFLPTTFSSHSYYMQVYLQLGFLGVALLVAVLLALWKPLSGAVTRPARFGAAVFLMFVLHNSTEVLAFQIGLLASIPAWCVIGMAYSLARAEPAQPAATGAAEAPLR